MSQIRRTPSRPVHQILNFSNIIQRRSQTLNYQIKLKQHHSKCISIIYVSQIVIFEKIEIALFKYVFFDFLNFINFKDHQLFFVIFIVQKTHERS